MPNKVEEFRGYRLYRLVERALRGIRVANGYNTNPYVTLDFNDGVEHEKSEQHVVVLEVTDHNIDDVKAGGNVRPRLVMEVTTTSNVDNEVPRVLSMALEQDVRTALVESVALVRDEINAGCVFRFGECSHDGGALAPQKQAGFVLEFSYTYPQGPTW